MKRKLLLLIISIMMLFTSIPAVASNNPVVYKKSITVTADGGRYQIGFVNVEFKKDFINPDMLPATFDVEVYAEDGVAYVEFAPDTPDFFKAVHIRTDAYTGLLYDKAAQENIEVSIKNYQVKASHFSRYAVVR